MNNYNNNNNNNIYYVIVNIIRVGFFNYFFSTRLSRDVIWVDAVAVVRGGANEREIGTQFHFYRGRLESKRTTTRTNARAPAQLKRCAWRGNRRRAVLRRARCSQDEDDESALWPQKKQIHTSVRIFDIIL